MLIGKIEDKPTQKTLSFSVDVETAERLKRYVKLRGSRATRHGTLADLVKWALDNDPEFKEWEHKRNRAVVLDGRDRGATSSVA